MLPQLTKIWFNLYKGAASVTFLDDLQNQGFETNGCYSCSYFSRTLPQSIYTELYFQNLEAV